MLYSSVSAGEVSGNIGGEGKCLGEVLHSSHLKCLPALPFSGGVVVEGRSPEERPQGDALFPYHTYRG